MSLEPSDAEYQQPRRRGTLPIRLPSQLPNLMSMQDADRLRSRQAGIWNGEYRGPVLSNPVQMPLPPAPQAGSYIPPYPAYPAYPTFLTPQYNEAYRVRTTPGIEPEHPHFQNRIRRRRASASSSSDSTSRSKFRVKSRKTTYYGHSHRVQLNGSSDSDGEYGSSTLYSFSPSRSGISRTFSKKDPITTASGDEGDFENGGLADPDPHPGRVPPVAYHVFESRYTGDGSPAGHHASELTVVADTKVKYQHMFRWFHFTRPTLDFEHFATEVSRIDKISTVERNTLTKMLSRIKRDFLHTVPLANGKEVRQMRPVVIPESIPIDSQFKDTRSRSLVWIVFPYFRLQPYQAFESGTDGATPVPARTLPQTKFAHAPKERDLQQAVCRVGENRRKELCLHVSQLWCMVLDNCEKTAPVPLARLHRLERESCVNC